MPTTWPSMLNSGPPELPRLMAASVWMKSSYGPWRMSRPRAETMPAVTVPPRPNGLPIASTQSPTRSVSESPNCTAGSGLSGFTCSRAMSPVSSRPSTLALSEVLSWRVTVISSAPSITWLLVTTSPDGIDDEARAQALHAPLRRGRLIVAIARPGRQDHPDDCG